MQEREVMAIENSAGPVLNEQVAGAAAGAYSLDGLLTVEEAAAKLRVAVRTVRSWRYLRKIPFTRLGRRLYVSAGVVEELLTRNAIPALPSVARQV